jgi:hypothetical protein
MHDKPLTRAEQDDLFRQMDKWFADGGIRPNDLVASEMENVFRMRATILQIRYDLIETERELASVLNENLEYRRRNT